MAQLGGSLSSPPPPRRGAARLPEEAGRAPSAAGPATPSGVGQVPPDCPRAERFLSRPPAPPVLALGDRCRGGHSTPHLQRVPRWAPGKRGQSRIQESHNTTNLLFQPLAHTRPPVPPLRAAHRLKGKNSPHSTWWGGGTRKRPPWEPGWRGSPSTTEARAPPRGRRHAAPPASLPVGRSHLRRSPPQTRLPPPQPWAPVPAVGPSKLPQGCCYLRSFHGAPRRARPEPKAARLQGLADPACGRRGRSGAPRPAVPEPGPRLPPARS